MLKRQTRKRDPRPAVAIGHVEHHVANVPKAVEWYASLGVRLIFRQRNFAVMEVRGGTHIIFSGSKKRIATGAEAPFDFIVDDVDAMRGNCASRGMNPGRMHRGSIHDWFELIDPSGYRLTILSSHASGRPV